MFGISAAMLSGILLAAAGLLLIGEILSLLGGLIESILTILVALGVIYALFVLFDPLSISAGMEFLREI